MAARYKHIAVTIAHENWEKGIKDFVKELGVKWKPENVKVEVNIFKLVFSLKSSTSNCFIGRIV